MIPLTDPFSSEQVERCRLATDIENMLSLRAWRWVEDRWTAMIDDAERAALRADTSCGGGIDQLRRWQLTDEIVSTLRADIQSILAERDQLLDNPADYQAVMLKEKLNARPRSASDSDSPF